MSHVQLSEHINKVSLTAKKGKAASKEGLTSGVNRTFHTLKTCKN